MQMISQFADGKGAVYRYPVNYRPVASAAGLFVFK